MPHRTLSIITVSYLSSLLFVTSVSAGTSFEVEIDPYYSNAGYYIGFGDKAIPEIVVKEDTSILRRMLHSTFAMPQSLLFEASVSPLPVLGVYARKNHPDIYQGSEISGDLNVIQALTAGFEEPYAVSVFLGSVVRFVEPGRQKKTENRGYSGYLLSMGDQHIINNRLVDDHWYELEWKIKGDQDFNNKTLSWSLRAGIKTHDHDDIANVYYIAFRRNHFDRKSDSLSLLGNSDIEYKLEFTRKDMRLAQQELFVDKKWPTLFSRKSSFSLGVGFIIQKAKYSGELAREADDFRFIIRPNLEF